MPPTAESQAQSSHKLPIAKIPAHATFLALAALPSLRDPAMPQNGATAHNQLSRRERQIMDFLFRVHRATAADVMEGLPDAPSYSAVRALLRILEQKGHIKHEEEGRAYVYMPLQRRDSARQSALSHLLKTFFDNS